MPRTNTRKPRRCAICWGEQEGHDKHGKHGYRPDFGVGDRVLINSSIHKDRVAIIRNFRANEDSILPFVVVDFEPGKGRAPAGSSMGWVFEWEAIIGPASDAGR